MIKGQPGVRWNLREEEKSIEDTWAKRICSVGEQDVWN